MRPANTVPPIRPILHPFLVLIARARAIVNDYVPTSANLPDPHPQWRGGESSMKVLAGFSTLGPARASYISS